MWEILIHLEIKNYVVGCGTGQQPCFEDFLPFFLSKHPFPFLING
jgi:hypothetical protein